MHAQANYDREVLSSWGGSKARILEKGSTSGNVQISCTIKRASEQMSQNWYHESKQVLEKTTSDNNQFSPKGLASC